MNLKHLIYSLTFLLFCIFSYGQNLTLVNGQNINISSGTKINISGLEFLPSSNFEITAPNSVTKSSIAIDAQSINRVFNFDNVVNNFQGNITLFYEDTELNGNSENDLTLNIEDEFSSWNQFNSSLDSNLNSISYNFLSPINFLSVTASNNSTLSISNSLTYAFNLYPNPTTKLVNINSILNTVTTIYNMNGQKLFVTNEKLIDISQLENGIYIFKIKDTEKNNLKIVKVIKH